MYPSQFEYLKAESVEEAISLLVEHPEAEILAGGQSLVPLQKTRFAIPSHVVDLNGIPELEFLENDGGIRVGAMTRHSALQESPLVQEHLYLFSECIGQIADWQVRNQGTIGGTIVEADPDGDYLPVMDLLNPEIIVEGPDGKRSVQFNSFYLGMFTVDLDNAEIVTEVRLPKLEPTEGASGIGSAYHKHAERSGDYAIVGEGAIVHVDDEGVVVDADLTVGAVGPLTRVDDIGDVISGTTLDDDSLAEASIAVGEAVTPDEDPQYKQAMAEEMASTVLQRAYERAIKY